MIAQRNRRWKFVALMGALFIFTVACSARDMVCNLSGGEWEFNEYDNEYECVGAGNIYFVFNSFLGDGPIIDSNGSMVSGPVINSDGEDVAPAQPAAADPGAEAAQEPAPQPQPEADAGEAPPPPADEAPPAPVTIASCIPQPGKYKIDIVDVDDRTSGSRDKRVCTADGLLSNNDKNEIMISVYRVDGKVEKWESGYTTVYPGDTVNFGNFYHCTGAKDRCENGENWLYFSKLSILYNTPECQELAWSYEDKIPESIVPIENPCAW